MAENITVDDAEYNSRRKLRQWFSQPLGNYLLDLEQLRISKILPKLFGYHVLQIGCLSRQELLASSRISHKILMLIGPDEINGTECNLLGDEESLAIASDSMDVVITK